MLFSKIIIVHEGGTQYTVHICVPKTKFSAVPHCAVENLKWSR